MCVSSTELLVAVLVRSCVGCKLMGIGVRDGSALVGAEDRRRYRYHRFLVCSCLWIVTDLIYKLRIISYTFNISHQYCPANHVPLYFPLSGMVGITRDGYSYRTIGLVWLIRHSVRVAAILVSVNCYPR